MIPFKGKLFDFVSKQVQVLDHMPVMTEFGSGYNVKLVKVRYLIVNIVSPYNIIIGRPDFNSLKYALSTMYLTMKYPLSSGELV